MESTLQAPYAFFEYFFNVTLYEEYERLKEDEQRNGYRYKDFYATLTDYIGVPHTEELIKSKNFVEQNISAKLAHSNELSQYLNFLRIKLSTFSETRAYQNFEFVRRYTKDLQEHLGKYGGTLPKATIDTNLEPSFLLLGSNEHEVQNKIDTLFNQLVEHPPIIDCSKEEFINAFTGTPINQGINWLVTGKNKMISKPSLFYLLEQLIDKEHLSKNIIHDLNKYVQYVFRDGNGEMLKNLKQSKATYSNKVANKDRIDEIINSL